MHTNKQLYLNAKTTEFVFFWHAMNVMRNMEVTEVLSSVSSLKWNNEVLPNNMKWNFGPNPSF